MIEKSVLDTISGTIIASGTGDVSNCYYPYQYYPAVGTVQYWLTPPAVTAAGVIQQLALLVEAGKISETTFVKCVEALKK